MRGIDMQAFVPRKEEERHALPVIEITFAEVRKLVDKRIPDNVCREIVKSEKPLEKIKEVNEAAEKIAKAVGGGAGWAFYALGNPDVGRRFAENPKEVIDAFGQIAKAAGEGAGWAFKALSNPDVGRRFADYCNGKISFERFFVALFLDDEMAIEIGRPLDELHDRDAERLEFLSKLPQATVVGLLCSNPELFYTSSNHLLFDRLVNAMNWGGLGGLVEKYALDEKQLQNLFFRAINFDRLYGSGNSIANKDELGLAFRTISSGLHAKKYSPQYFYLFANALENIGRVLPGIREELRATEMEAQDARQRLAIKFLMENREAPTEVKFDRKDYSVGGKVQVLQVFDREDTQNDHWIYTQNWFEAQMGKPKIGENGELIYENSKSRVAIFMGENEEANREFAKEWMRKNGRGIITFRGHSFSLKKNLPYDVFGDMDGKFLFIPGSCGSAGSIPAYMEANPKTDITFFSNTSTGRGQVTNAIIDLLLAQQTPAAYDAILKKGANAIEQNGGNITSIKTITLGYLLIKYVQENSQAE